MRCEGCTATVSRWSASSLCPACHAIAGAALPIPDQRRPRSALWLWTSDDARAALATGDLAVIIRAYRAATGASQRQLADLLGYDPTYISMIETGRREINDVATRLRIAQHLALPPHTIGVSDPEDADFTAMLQFGESTIRLAVIARQSGHGAEAVNELRPLVTRLERRLADGHVEHDVLVLLTRARAELGVSLGYVLPEERLASAARWTGQALRLAEHLEDQDLLAFALRVHGNELRKNDHPTAAVARLHRSAGLIPDGDRGAVLVQLARAVGELGDPVLFDHIIDDAWRNVDASSSGSLASPYALHEVHLRGLLRTGRAKKAIELLNHNRAADGTVPPQWRAILQVTSGEILLARTDIRLADAAFRSAVSIAVVHRLPHQIQRALRAASHLLPDVAEFAQNALQHLRVNPPAADN